MAALLVLSLAACGGAQPAATPDVSAAPTEAPYIHTQIDEPEWTLIEGVMTLDDSTGTVAQGEDFLYFAIVGATPAEMELWFRLDDAKAAALSTETDYTLTFNGEPVGKGRLNDEHTVVVKSADAAIEITRLATRIRGLETEY